MSKDVKSSTNYEWESQRRRSLENGMDSPQEIVRQDSNADLFYGDTERPADPCSYLPGPNRGEKRRK